MMRAESKRLATVLDEKCAATPTHPAILYRDRTICYAELQDESLAAARSLFALGIGRGDRVGILLGHRQIGRASCRERVCQIGEKPGDGFQLKQTLIINKQE